MSLTKLLKAPMKLFRKEVITFIIIRRYDLGTLEDKLRYVAVKPTASTSLLRQKIWYLLDLPDFSEEVIVLKSGVDMVIPLTELRKGNDPQHPYVLEVWLPPNRFRSNISINNKLLTIENGEECSNIGNQTATDMNDVLNETKQLGCPDNTRPCNCANTTISNETIALNKFRFRETPNNILLSDFKSDLSCRISTTSLFRLNGKKSRDNFTNVLLKIQSDLTTLSNKLSNLENRIKT